MRNVLFLLFLRKRFVFLNYASRLAGARPIAETAHNPEGGRSSFSSGACCSSNCYGVKASVASRSYTQITVSHARSTKLSRLFPLNLCHGYCTAFAFSLSHRILSILPCPYRRCFLLSVDVRRTLRRPATHRADASLEQPPGSSKCGILCSHMTLGGGCRSSQRRLGSRENNGSP